jgi:hypothetical protein
MGTYRSQIAGAALAALAGLLFGLWLLPPEFIDPTRVDWVLAGDDTAASWLSWQYFRNEPWALPPGRVVGYGLEMGSSVVYTDSIPLAALLLKPFSFWLPAQFSYLGPWALLSLVLTPAFAYVCGLRAGRSVAAGAACALIAVTSGYLLVRVQGHFSLSSHWLVWWALAVYLGRDGAGARSQRLLCLPIALGVHAYLFVLVAAVVGADLLRRVAVTGERRLGAVVAEATAAAVLCAAAMWAYGYFVLSGAGGATPDFGAFAATVDTFWWRSNPSMESAVYLGAGVLAGALLALAALVYVDGAASASVRGHWPLIGAVLVTALIAMSPQIAWRDGVLFPLGLSESMQAQLSTFRANGRLAWLAAAVLILAAVSVVRWVPGRRRALAVLGLLVGLHVLDFHASILAFRDHLSTWESRQRPAALPSAEQWNDVIADHQTVLVAPMDHMAAGWRELAPYAARISRPINVGYFSRASWERFAPAYTQINTEITTARLRENALYVVTDRGRVDTSAIVAAGCTREIDGQLVASAHWCASRVASSNNSVDATGSGPVPAPR